MEVSGNTVRDLLTADVVSEAGIHASNRHDSPLRDLGEGVFVGEVLCTEETGALTLLETAFRGSGRPMQDGSPHLVVLVRVEWLAPHQRGKTSTLYLADLSGTQDLEDAAAAAAQVSGNNPRGNQERSDYRAGLKTNNSLVRGTRARALFLSRHLCLDGGGRRLRHRTPRGTRTGCLLETASAFYLMVCYAFPAHPTHRTASRVACSIWHSV